MMPRCTSRLSVWFCFGAGGLREVARLKIQQEDEEVDSRLTQVTQTLNKVRM
jgi:hypothetical protein